MQVEWLFLADSAEVIQNRLYTMGGGWESLQVHTDFPIIQHFSVALSVKLDRTEVGVSHEFALDLEDPNGNLLATVEADFELIPESDTSQEFHRWQFATSVDLEITQTGQHQVIIHLAGQEKARLGFQVSKAEA
jgi:hypothetical protein